MKQALIKFVTDHLRHFKAYPMEFEYNNKVYDYKTIMKIINNRKDIRKWQINKKIWLR